jgi:hypothetical protein
LARLKKKITLQLLISTLILSTFGKIDLIICKYASTYQSANLETGRT